MGDNNCIKGLLILTLKVPTLLVYPHGSASPSSWGFLAETAQEISGAGNESREWFKIMLDEHLLEQMRKKSSDPSKVPRIHEVEKWYVSNLTVVSVTNKYAI